MTPAEATTLLVEERSRTLALLADLNGTHAGVVAASLDSNADDEHDPEGATIAFERAQVEALVRQATHSLAELDAAQGRAQRGDYGVCGSCGRGVPDDRLRARPTARTCVGCA